MMKLRPYKFTSLVDAAEINSLEKKIDENGHNPCDFLEFIGNHLIDGLDVMMVELDEKNMLLICQDSVANTVGVILKKFGLPLQITDATDEIFNGKIDISNFNDELKEKIEDIILENFDQDQVYDKINISGVGCMTEMDKKILNK